MESRVTRKFRVERREHAIALAQRHNPLCLAVADLCGLQRVVVFGATW